MLREIFAGRFFSVSFFASQSTSHKEKCGLLIYASIALIQFICMSLKKVLCRRTSPQVPQSVSVLDLVPHSYFVIRDMKHEIVCGSVCTEGVIPPFLNSLVIGTFELVDLLLAILSTVRRDFPGRKKTRSVKYSNI